MAKKSLEAYSFDCLLTLRRTRVFVSFFFPEDKTTVPDVFSSCSFISRAHFEISLLIVSCYGDEI